MNEDEMRDKLKLTPDQKRAFNSLKRSLKDFESLGGVLVGSNEFQYALNGVNFVDAHDYYQNDLEENYIRLCDADLESIIIRDPFNDAEPYIEVRE